MTVDDRRIYLDYNATSPLLPEAREALVAALDLFGNPSSVHGEGRMARAAVEKARRHVAALLSADAENVLFTSGATEAATTCLTPFWFQDGMELHLQALAVLDSDHPATREGGRFEPNAMTRLGVDANGLLRFDDLAAWLRQLDGAPAMLAIGHANGETGVIQPITEIRDRLVGHSVVFVLDAAQTAGRLWLDNAELGADAVLLSGHKLGAVKGTGALVLASEVLRPSRLIPGGGQEKGMRSGTEALPAIASFGRASEIVATEVGRRDHEWKILRDRLIATLRAGGVEFTVVGEDAERLANTVALAFADRKAESVQIALDLQGFATSSGSACSSGKVGLSHALLAMARSGAPFDPDKGLLRISFGRETESVHIDRVAAALCRILTKGGMSTGQNPLAA